MADTADPLATRADLLDEAVELVRRAGELTLQWFRDPDLAVEHKGDGTPVTEADRAAEALLRHEIGRAHPDDSIIGEEHDDQLGGSGRTWIIDPIDGTKAFMRGVPLYSNLLAVEDDEGPLIGIINLPALGQTVYAARGLGCFLDGQRVQVSTPRPIDGAFVSSSGFTIWDDDALLRLKHAGCSLRTWGDGYGYALVATGRIDAMVDPVAARWDLAAMPVIIAEAGGRFSDFAGACDAATGSGVATGGVDHDELLSLVAPR